MTEAEFRHFHAETADDLLRYVSRYCGDMSYAEDVVQDAYYRFLRTSHPSDAAGRRRYVFRIATNLVRDHFRRVARRRETDLHEAETIPAPQQGRVAEEDLSDVMAAMSARARKLLWLAYVEGYSHKEIGQIVGVTEQSVRSLLYRARQTFAELLGARESRLERGVE